MARDQLLVGMSGVSRLGLAFAAIALADAGVAYGQPNVVVIYADDMGWTDWQRHAVLNPTGSPVFETPNLLRLAGSGVNFTNGYASAPVCSPSRAALLTGQTPARLNFTDHTGGGVNTSARLRSPVWTNSLPAAQVTLAEALGSPAGGYDTAFIGKWHVGGSPTSQGYDSNVAGGNMGCPCDGEGGFFAGPDGRWSGMPGIDTPGAYAPDAYLTDVLGGFAENYIAQKATGPNPFFLTFAPYQVHVPLQAPAPLISKYAAKIALLQSQGVDLRGHDEPVYGAMVEALDTAVGRVLNRLEDPNGDGNTADSIRDNTLIVFSSDNGGLTVSELGDPIPTQNAPLREGKGSLYEGGLRTTTLVSWTGNNAVPQGVLSDSVVVGHDLYPTLLQATGRATVPGVPQNTIVDGVSFLGALQGQPHNRAPILWHYPHQSNQHKVSGGTVTAGSFVSAVRDGDLKLVFFYEDRRYELYNLAVDTNEANNLIAAGSLAEARFRASAALYAGLLRSAASMPVDRVSGLSEPLPPVLWETSQGDFNDDGLLTLADWSVLRDSFGMAMLAAHPADAYRLGDFNLDGRVDRIDFGGFKDAFDTANGAGAFERLVAGVPESSAAGMAGAAVSIGVLRRGERR